MGEYRKYDVEVTESKGKKKFTITNNYFDKSDCAFYGKDGQLTSYSPYAVNFVKRCIKGVEDILENAKVGHNYTIFTDGVHGKALRYEDKAARKINKTDIFSSVENHKKSLGADKKDKPHENKKSKEER